VVCCQALISLSTPLKAPSTTQPRNGICRPSPSCMLSSTTCGFCHCYIITFCASRRQCKIYCGYSHLCVCLSAAVRPHYCTDLDVTWGHGRGCPLVVHYWADLQSGHGLRCYGNITQTLVTSFCPSRDMATYRSTNGRLGGVCVHCWPQTAGGGVFSKLHTVYGKWAWLARR